jgi:predicted ATPase
LAAGIEPGVFVGRELELARLKAAFAGCVETPPAGRTIIVGGEAGIGKSRLVRELARTAEAKGATILIGACLPTAGGSVPYAPIVEALRDLTRSIDPALLAGALGPARAEISRLLPEIGSPATPSQPDIAEADRGGQGRLFEAILTVLERRGRDGPVVLAIEDIQWADIGTRGLVTFLSRNLRDQPVLLLLTVRTDDLEASIPTVRLLAEL